MDHMFNVKSLSSSSQINVLEYKYKLAESGHTQVR